MIKLGMIGGGVNSAVGQAHVAALRASGKFDLYCGCFSSQPKMNKLSAQQYGVKVGYGTVPSLLESDCERFVVLSPTPAHFQHVLAALGTGKPVLCEKALGVNATETANLVVLSQRHNVPLSVVFNYAFYPAVQRMRELIQDLELGQLTHVHVEMPQASYLLNQLPQPWRLTDEGIYLDLMTHLHHLLWFLTGHDPEAVQAVERSWSSKGVIDYVSAQLRYDHFQAHLWFSKVSAGHSNGLRVRVYGTNGSLEWWQREPDTLLIGGAEAPEAIIRYEVPNPRFKLGHPTGYVDALTNLYAAWADDPNHPDLCPKVAHRGLCLMHAMRESAREEAWKPL